MKIINYKVTIEMEYEEERIAGKEWARTTADVNTPYAYTPEITKTVRLNDTIYTQTLTDLDLKSVISAVNGGLK